MTGAIELDDGERPRRQSGGMSSNGPAALKTIVVLPTLDHDEPGHRRSPISAADSGDDRHTLGRRRGGVELDEARRQPTRCSASARTAQADQGRGLESCVEPEYLRVERVVERPCLIAVPPTQRT